MEELTREELKELAIKRGAQAHDLLMENSNLKDQIRELEIQNAVLKKALTELNQEQYIKDGIEIANKLFNLL